MTRTEKRRTPRIQPYVAPCRILHRSRRLSGYLADLSPRGARVACVEEPPSAGEPVVIEVRFGRSVVHSALPAEVKWVQPPGRVGDGYVCGLTFRGLPAEAQKVLDSVLEEFRRRAAELA